MGVRFTRGDESRTPSEAFTWSSSSLRGPRLLPAVDGDGESDAITNAPTHAHNAWHLPPTSMRVSTMVLLGEGVGPTSQLHTPHRDTTPVASPTSSTQPRHTHIFSTPAQHTPHTSHPTPHHPTTHIHTYCSRRSCHWPGQPPGGSHAW